MKKECVDGLILYTYCDLQTPKPGEENENDSYFALAGYRVSKGSSKGVLAWFLDIKHLKKN